nr:kinetochore protein NDC80 homolog [Setaria viridis]
MRRGGGGGGGAGRRLPKSSLALSALDATPALDSSAIPIRNLDSAFSRRDSDAASLCSSRPASSVGVGVGAGPNFSDRATQAAALRIVNGYLSPAVTLRGPLPAARDIQAALRLLLERIDFPPNEATFEDDLIQALRLLGCPHKITRSALKAPGTPHSWPPLLSVLHWLTLFAQYSDADASSAAEAPPNDLLLYTTQGYCHFLSGDDDAVEALDEEYLSKARMDGEAAVAKVRALEKDVQELEAEVNKLTSGPLRREALEAQKEALTADVHKFEAVVKTWKTKIDERDEALVDLEKELEAKVLDAQCTAAENQELLKKVDAQALNVRDMERMHREMLAIERDIANAENGKAALEDKAWELDAKLVTKLEELEGLAEQCNQALKRLKPGIDFQYMINSKGSSPAEMLGPGYKTVLKPALMAHAEENKRITVSNLAESVDLQKQLQGSAKILEEEKSNISTLQARHDKMVARLNLLDGEITNDDSRCTAEARRMKDELEKKYNAIRSVEKEADEFLKNSEKRLQDAILKNDEETQAAATELLQLLESIAEHKEFMEATIAQRRKELYEAADYIASLASKTSSPSPHV